MKVLLTFKTPDVIRETLDDSVMHLDPTDPDYQDRKEQILAEVEQACEKFIKYGEYIDIEIDTKTKTAEVQEL